MPDYISSRGDIFPTRHESGDIKKQGVDIGRKLIKEQGGSSRTKGELLSQSEDHTEDSFFKNGRKKFKSLLEKGFTTREITPWEKIAASVKMNNTEQYHEAHFTLKKADQATQKEWRVFRGGQDDIKRLYKQQMGKISELHDYISKQIDIHINGHQEEIKKASETKNQGETTIEHIERLNKDFEKDMNGFRSLQNGRWKDLKNEQNKQRIKLDARLANGLNALNAKDKLEKLYRALPKDLPPQEQDKIAELKKAHVDEIEALSAKNIKEIDKLSVPGNVSPPETLSGEREKSIEELPKRDFKERMEKIVNKHYEEWVKLEKLQKGEYENMGPSKPLKGEYENIGPSKPLKGEYENMDPSNPFKDEYEDMDPSNPFKDEYEDMDPSNPFDDKYKM